MGTDDRIQSIRQTLAGGYKKPEPEKVEAFCSALQQNEEAIHYLKVKRGLTDDTIKHFKLGYDSGRNAISIPVYKSGELVNIRYRYLDEKDGRYTQEKGCEVWLYNDVGVDRAKKFGNLLVVEGEFDLMSAWQAGFKSVVSPASGKDSYGPWIELLDAVPRVYIAYDNDKPGKKASMEMAERVGIDKSYEVLYPDDIKDANEYFLRNTKDEFAKLITSAQPYYKHKYSAIGDIIDGLRDREEKKIELDTVPFVKWKSDWLAIISADSNGGKTTYALNIANELVEKDVPTLFLPFERGVRDVGPRYIQVRYGKQEEDLQTIQDEEIEKMKVDSVNLPLYFSEPSRETFYDTVKRAKRLFGIKFFVIDHLDYFIRGDNKVAKQADFVHELKEFCIAEDLCCILIHHIAKDKEGRKRKRKLTKEDLKGASDVYQIPEVVILMYPDDEEGYVIIDVDKNKGKQGCARGRFDMSTGRMSVMQGITREEMARYQREAEEQWNA